MGTVYNSPTQISSARAVVDLEFTGFDVTDRFRGTLQITEHRHQNSHQPRKDRLLLPSFSSVPYDSERLRIPISHHGSIPQRGARNQCLPHILDALYPNRLSSDSCALSGSIHPRPRPQNNPLPTRKGIPTIRLRSDKRFLRARRTRASRISRQGHRAVHSERVVIYIDPHQSFAQA